MCMLDEIGYVKAGGETSTWRLAYGVWFLKMYDSSARRGTVVALSESAGEPWRIIEVSPQFVTISSHLCNQTVM